MSSTMRIYRVANNDEEIYINGADALALEAIGVLVVDRVHQVAPGFVVHHYRKAD